MTKNFKYLDELIHSGLKEIVLDSNIVLDDEEELNYDKGINVDVDDLTIDGNGYVIDARDKMQIFDFTGKSITLKNITLKKGFSRDDSPIINSNGAELNIINSIITGNRGSLRGVISNEKGNINIMDSDLSFNWPLYGGVIRNEMGKVCISNSIISNNIARRGHTVINLGDLEVINSKIYNNRGEIEGAIFNGNKLTVRNSLFSENSIMYNGGAICNGGESIIDDSIFSHNRTQFNGGAIFNKRGNLKVNDSTFEGNSARMGGAIFNVKSKALLSLKNCDFKDNRPDDVISIL